jgi:hypothetical protein
MSERAPDHGLPPVKHERTDVTFRAMLALFALILATLLLMLGIAYWLFPAEMRDQRFMYPFPSFPAPKLQAAPAVDMRAFYAEEMRRLNGTGWQDKAAGVVHIPIQQAMDLVAKEGISGWPTNSAASQGARR